MKNCYSSFHKLFYKVIVLVVFLFSFQTCLYSQVSSYTFAQSSGAYSAIAGGTVYLNSGTMDDFVSGAITIPSFTMNCVAYTSIFISTNGFITFGSAPNTTDYTPISGATGYSAAVSGFGGNLLKATTGTPEIRYLDVVATSEFVIQWQDMRVSGVAGERVTFQIRLNYSTNVINIVYGPQTSVLTSSNLQVGLRGASNSDFNNRTNTLGWALSAAGGANNSTCSYSSLATPASGQTYTFTPGVLAFSSCTAVQASVATVTKCDLDQAIISLQVVTTGCTGSLNLTQIIMNETGTTSATLDVSLIHVYYTGTTNVFNTTNEFVSGGTAAAAGNITLNGSQTLTGGTNYFWIAYDINSASTVGDVVDAQLVASNSVTVGGTARTPTANNPAGSRSIVACPPFVGTASGNLKFWVKSDVGVTGAAVSAWADQSTAGVTGNLIGQASTKRPTFTANAINFQPYIVFDGANDFMRTANKFVGTNLFNSTDNTILMVKQYYGGGVDFKWSDVGSGPYRMSMELTGSNTQRFDFANDGGVTPPPTGQTIGATSILNKDIILAAQSNSTTSTLFLNGNQDASFTYSLVGGPLTFSPPVANTRALFLGGNDTVFFVIPASVKLGEVLIFNKQLSTAELKRQQTYLAIKYGITLGNNQGSGSAISYISSDGTQIWSSKGYHNYVIGIGRDNAAGNSGLNKLKSTSVSSLNGSTDILTITNGTTAGGANPWTGAAFSADKSFLIVGNDAGSTFQSAIGAADLPSGIQARIDRVWKAQETGTVGTVTLKFDMSTVLGVGNVGGANDLTNVRLLVDADGVFAAGATIISPTAFNNTSDTVVFQTDFAAGTGFFFSIGSVDVTTAPLPIELTSFTSACDQKNTIIKWTTTTETNNDYFTVEKSIDAITYTTLAKVAGAGTTIIPQHYSVTDFNPFYGTTYYRLKQTDYNGQSKIFNDITANCGTNVSNTVYAYNNQQGNIVVSVEADVADNYTFNLFSSLGSKVMSQQFETNKGTNTYNMDISTIRTGIYFITIDNGQKPYTQKIFIK